MAAKALVLVEVAVGKVEDVAEAARKIEGVKAVDAVTGPYDLVVTVEAAEIGAIGNLVTRKIHTIPHLSKTTTCVVVKSF